MKKEILKTICEIATSEIELNELSEMLHEKAEWMKTQGLMLIRVGKALRELSRNIEFLASYLDNKETAMVEKKLWMKS